MLSILKEKIPFLKDKTLDEYNQTILTPSFNMIDISTNASYIGIDIDTYKQVIDSKKNVNSLDINYHVMKLINYINKVVFDDDFIKNIVTKIVFVTNYGYFECHNKSFTGFVKIGDNQYKFALTIDITSITYGYEYLSQKERGSFKIEKDGIKIKNSFISKKVIKDDNVDHYQIDNYTNLEVYNMDQKQQFGHKIIQKHNYYQKNGQTEKIVNQINSNENYTENDYIWKCPNNTIIKKREVKYHYPQDQSKNFNDINECLIAKNISPNNYKLPTKGIFYHFDNELFQDYYCNRCDINALWDNAYIYKSLS